MAASGPPPRRRPRRGSIERPVSGRIYRGTWLLVGVPLLVAAFSVTRPPALAAPPLPPAFDDGAARAAATQLADTYPNRTPGSVGARGAADWFSRQLESFGLSVEDDTFEATIVGLGRRRLRNVAAVVAGQSPDTIVVMAHRDDTGEGQGADDNASGTAALIELARAYAAPADAGTAAAAPVAAAHRIVFLSTDGGAFGGVGVERFLEQSAYRHNVVAVVNLDAIAGRDTPRLEIAGDFPRSPAATLVRTAAARLEEESGSAPRRPSALAQLVDLAFPFSLYEQAPFVGRGIPAITITTGGSHPRDAFSDRPGGLSTSSLGAVGRATQNLLGSLDAGLELAQGTTAYIWLGERVLRGWAVELVLIAALTPFLAAAVDLFARCRRRHIRLRPAFAAYRSRVFFWLFVGALFELFALLGVWPKGDARPIAPHLAAAHDLPAVALVGLGTAALAAWAIARQRLQRRRPITAAEELAGHTAALLALGVIALVVLAVNPFALVFVLPSLHAWLWLPQSRGNPLLQAALILAGLVGPALLLWSFGERFGLGTDAAWYVAALLAVGYVPLPLFVLFLVWVAAGGQLLALAAGRYAPYPEPRERGPRGPVRELVRTIALAGRRLRRPAEPRRRAAAG